MSNSSNVITRLKEFGPWSEQISSSGKRYYYNRDTEVSQWEKPSDWKDQEKSLLEKYRSQKVKKSSAKAHSSQQRPSTSSSGSGNVNNTNIVNNINNLAPSLTKHDSSPCFNLKTNSVSNNNTFSTPQSSSSQKVSLKRPRDYDRQHYHSSKNSHLQSATVSDASSRFADQATSRTMADISKRSTADATKRSSSDASKRHLIDTRSAADTSFRSNTDNSIRLKEDLSTKSAADLSTKQTIDSSTKPTADSSTKLTDSVSKSTTIFDEKKYLKFYRNELTAHRRNWSSDAYMNEARKFADRNAKQTLALNSVDEDIRSVYSLLKAAEMRCLLLNQKVNFVHKQITSLETKNPLSI